MRDKDITAINVQEMFAELGIILLKAACRKAVPHQT